MKHIRATLRRRTRIAVLICLSLLLPFALQAKTLRVLFIGNSYTYVNNLPQITADVAASMGDTLLYDSYTVGGYSFWDHYFDPLCAQKIASAQWDYVILQEQSFAPAAENHDFMSESYAWANGLNQKIQANDSCTKVMYYMTWGYKDGVPDYCSYAAWPYPCTYEGMDSLVNLRYRAYADSNVLATMGYSSATINGFSAIRPAVVSPVGAVRHYIRDHYPAIELYQADGSHPTPAGSYAGACTFYVALFRKDPTLVPYDYTLSATDAAHIRSAAKLIAYDSMSHWYIGTDLRAGFAYSASAGNTVSFTNASTAATHYLWDFGDGNTATASAPVHTYAGNGTYLVKLVAFNASCSDTSVSMINTSPTSTGNLNTLNPHFTISPNPAKDVVNIHATKLPPGAYQLSVSNTLGQPVYSVAHITSDQQIDISAWNSGIYFLMVKSGNNIVYQYKLLKL